mmetsp:Transcript_29040/g.44312  ORF Transcript_29040/g.44312 Transcript_29040/m.44312 type:complete len:201 (+) Transcript_29040:238-840(+)
MPTKTVHYSLLNSFVTNIPYHTVQPCIALYDLGHILSTSADAGAAQIRRNRCKCKGNVIILHFILTFLHTATQAATDTNTDATNTKPTGPTKSHNFILHILREAHIGEGRQPVGSEVPPVAIAFPSLFTLIIPYPGTKHFMNTRLSIHILILDVSLEPINVRHIRQDDIPLINNHTASEHPKQHGFHTETNDPQQMRRCI